MGLKGVPFAVGGNDLGIILLDGVGYVGGDDEAVGEWIWNGKG